MKTVHFTTCALALPLQILAPLAGCAVEPAMVDPPAPTVAAQVEAPPQAAAAADDDYRCGLPAPTGSVFMEVAHDGQLLGIARVGDRVVSQDEERWYLWDAHTRNVIAGGIARTTSRIADLAAGLALTPHERGLALRNATDGTVQAIIDTALSGKGTARLAKDGSYAYVADARSVRAYDRSGRLLFEHKGNFESAAVFATPTELRVANRLSPSFLKISLTGDIQFSPTYEGTFRGWFVDGEHFATLRADGMGVYDAQGELVNVIPFPEPFPASGRFAPLARGVGPYIWIGFPGVSRRIYVHRIDDRSLVETFEGEFANPDLQKVAFTPNPVSTEWNLRVYDVDPTKRKPVATELPIPPQTSFADYTIDDHGSWAAAGNRGEVYIAAPKLSDPYQVLGCARPLSLAGVGDRVAIVTSDMKIRVYDLLNGQRKHVRTLDVLPDAYTAEVAFAKDGRYLVVHRGVRDILDNAPVEVYDLERNSSGRFPAPVVLAHEGKYIAFMTTPHSDRLAIRVCADTCVVHVSKVDGSDHWQTPVMPEAESFSLDPTGTHLAVTSDARGPSTSWSSVYTSLIFGAGGQQVGAVANVHVMTWLDPARLLVRDDGWRPETVLHVVDIHGKESAALPRTLTGRWSPFYADSPDYFYGSGYVYRTADLSIAWDPTPWFPGLSNSNAREQELQVRLTGQALVGDNVLVGVDRLVHIARYR